MLLFKLVKMEIVFSLYGTELIREGLLAKNSGGVLVAEGVARTPIEHC